LEAIIADDNVLITDTTVFPWRCICHLVITASDSSRWVGTGWLASPRLVVTAGHCVYLHGAGGWAQKVEVYPGRNGNDTPFGSYVSTTLRSGSRWTEEPDAEYDYGAILLPEGTTVGYFGYGVFEDPELREATVYVCGYSADKPMGTLWKSTRRLAQVRERTLDYDKSLFGGQSGSPVFIKQGENHIALGIHTHGDHLGDSATRITDAVFDNFAAWKGEAELPVMSPEGYDRPVEGGPGIQQEDLSSDSSSQDDADLESDSSEQRVAWVLPMMQSLALTFHVGKLELPDLAWEKRAEFYSLDTEDKWNDFVHVRYQSEYLWAGPVTDFLTKGVDPFNTPSAEKRSRLREQIGQARPGSEKPWGARLSLRSDLEQVFALASPVELRQMGSRIGDPNRVLQVLDNGSEESLREVLD
jgi:V8-like Glu-specific endopeptidase